MALMANLKSLFSEFKKGQDAFSQAGSMFGNIGTPLPPQPDLEEPSLWERLFDSTSPKVQAWNNRFATSDVVTGTPQGYRPSPTEEIGRNPYIPLRSESTPLGRGTAQQFNEQGQPLDEQGNPIVAPTPQRPSFIGRMGQGLGLLAGDIAQKPGISQALQALENPVVQDIASAGIIASGPMGIFRNLGTGVKMLGANARIAAATPEAGGIGKKVGKISKVAPEAAIPKAEAGLVKPEITFSKPATYSGRQKITVEFTPFTEKGYEYHGVPVIELSRGKGEKWSIYVKYYPGQVDKFGTTKEIFMSKAESLQEAKQMAQDQLNKFWTFNKELGYTPQEMMEMPIEQARQILKGKIPKGIAPEVTTPKIEPTIPSPEAIKPPTDWANMTWYRGTKSLPIEGQAVRGDISYFTNVPEVATGYGRGEKGGRVIEATLDIKNPKIEKSAPMVVSSKYVRQLQAQGYDALIQDTGAGRYDVIAFNKTQVKVKPPAVEAPLVKGGVVPPTEPPIPPSGIVAAVEGTKPSGKYFLPEPPRTPTDYMAFARKEVAGSFKGKTGVLDTIEQARQQVLKVRDMGQNTVPYVMSYIHKAGNVVKEFGKDAQGMVTKIGNPEGRSLAINDVLSNYTHYKLTPVQAEIAKREGFVYKEAMKLAKSYGVKISELGGPDEYWQYIARRVKSKLNPMTGQYETPIQGAGAFKMGSKISAQKERVFDEMSQGVDLGYLYENPDQVMANHIKGIYRLIGNKQAENMVKPLTREITKQAPLQFGERGIAEPALRSRAATQEVANAIDKIFTPETEIKALRVVADINRVLVGQVAAMDLSAPFIQGLPVLGHDLKMALKGKPSFTWAKAYGHMWQAVKNPETINKFRTQNADLYKRFIEAGGMTGESEFVTGVGTAQRMLGKIPKVGKTLQEVYRQSWGRMGQSYSDFLEVAKVKLFEQMEPVWTKEGQNIYSLGAVINRTAGATSAAARGVSANRRLAEGAVAFAPNYLRSSLLLMKDLIGRSATAKEVQSSLAALLGVGATVYYAEEKIRGEEPKMKPWPKRLGGDGADAFTMLVGNTRVGFGSWMYGMIKTLAEVGAVAVDDPSALIVFDNTHPIIRYLKSKEGPIVGLVGELATGRTFWGQPFDSPDDYLMRLVETVVPISGQSMITQEPKGEPAQIGAELLGMRAFPYTFKGKWEKDLKAYNELPTTLAESKIKRLPTRDKYRQDNPEVDAKLFIAGYVNTVKTAQAAAKVWRLVKDEKIDPRSIAGVKLSQKNNEARLKAGLKDTLTDRLVKELLKSNK